MAKYRILSLDGGGIRGLIPIGIIERLDEKYPDWREQIDLIAGTSTGGIIALGLAKGLAPSELHRLYYEKGSRIFYSPWWNKIASIFNLFGAKHPNDHLREELQGALGDILLKDLKKKVLITTFKLNDEKWQRWKAKFFHNFEEENGTDREQKAVDVALYTSAAPTFFPSASNFIDGGVAANNPSMAALTQTQDHRAVFEPRPKLKEIVILSLGTGDIKNEIPGKNKNWGFVQWGWKINLLNILMSGVVEIPDYQCRQLIGEQRYWRINPPLPEGKDFNLDSVSRRDELVRIAADLDLSSLYSWIETTWLKD